MRIIIFDFEVFPKAVLLGTIIVDKDGEHLQQIWGSDNIRNFYLSHSDDMWVGWNNYEYDNIVLEGILNCKDPYSVSKSVINRTIRPFAHVPKYNFDIMRALNTMLSLKLTELISGSSIETTEVDFELQRELTDEEIEKTNFYNKADLEKTLTNFKAFYHLFELQLDIIGEFNLPMSRFLNATDAQIASAVLGAHQKPSLKYDRVAPINYENLSLKNEKLLKYYYDEGFRDPNYFAAEQEAMKATGRKYDKHAYKEINMIHIGNASLILGSGGLHYAERKCYYKKLIYGDVSGAYNLVMIYYNLFSRTIPEEGIEKYKSMFVSQKALKKTNPRKRAAFKTILLAVYGAQMNEKTDLYDPWHGLLVPITLQLFVIDLLEKLEPYVHFVQVNTDGIMFDLNDWSEEPIVQTIIKSWEDRTHFELKLGYVYDYYGRDVNNYVMKEEDGSITYKGEAFKNYDIGPKGYSSGAIFKCTNPPIVAKGLINYLLYDKTPDVTIEENKRDLRCFQIPCNRGTYEGLVLVETHKDGTITSSPIQSPSRAFASNDHEVITCIKKQKHGKKGLAMDKVANTPDNLFVYNDEILSDEAYEHIASKIDYSWYEDRIYSRINEFLLDEESET